MPYTLYVRAKTSEIVFVKMKKEKRKKNEEKRKKKKEKRKKKKEK